MRSDGKYEDLLSPAPSDAVVCQHRRVYGDLLRCAGRHADSARLSDVSPVEHVEQKPFDSCVWRYLNIGSCPNMLVCLRVQPIFHIGLLILNHLSIYLLLLLIVLYCFH